MNLHEIGTLIAKERQLRTMTQEELGSTIGIGKAQISKIESGNSLSIKTISALLKKLNLEMDISLHSIQKITPKASSFLVACISEFANHTSLTLPQASSYLNRYFGLDFIVNHYESQHLTSIEDTVEDLILICRKHGGGI